MKKKLLVSTLAAFGAVCCAVGFAACDKGGNDIGKDTDISEVKSQTVTEAQWKDAFKEENFNNFKAIVKVTQTRTDGTGTTTQTGTQELQLDGNKCYEKDTYETDSREYYYATVEGVHYMYEKEDTAWTREQKSYSMIAEIKEMFIEYGDMYSDFAYSEADKGYKMTDADGEEGHSDLIIKITNGKLSGFISDSTSAYEGEIRTYLSETTFYDYGKASVTLPNVQGSDDNNDNDDDDNDDQVGSQVTEAQWKAALSGSVFENYTMTAIGEMKLDGQTVATMHASLVVDTANNRLHAFDDSEGEEDYALAKEGDKYYYFEKKGGNGWTRSEVTLEQFQNEWATYSSMSDMFGEFLESYSEFAYNSATGAYVAEDFENGLGKVELKFADGKLVSFQIVIAMPSGTMTQTMTLSAYGTTSVALPAEYTDAAYGGGSGDNTPSKVLDVDGCSFHVVNVVGDDCPEDMLDQIRKTMDGATYSFHNGEFEIITDYPEVGRVVQSGKYEQNGNVLELTLASMTVDGQPQELPSEGERSLTMYLEGANLFYEDTMTLEGGSVATFRIIFGLD